MTKRSGGWLGHLVSEFLGAGVSPDASAGANSSLHSPAWQHVTSLTATACEMLHWLSKEGKAVLGADRDMSPCHSSRQNPDLYGFR